jgi:hypothetical protein
METKYVVIEDDTNIYYTHKKYDAYFTMKIPVQISEEDYENKYTLEILMQNNNNDQIVLISLYKYKLLDFLAKLGGIMKIITFMKMTGKFWSSFFYEKTLYNLLVKRENPYLSQKKKLLESLVYKNANKLNKEMTPESGESKIYIKKENMNSPINNIKNDKNSMSYASYTSWFLNRFCKCFFIDSEAKKKREMLAGTLGLNNYLLHLDYIDRQILLEQHSGNINQKIEEIIYELKKSICSYCYCNIQSNEFKLPCGCNFCSYEHLNSFFSKNVQNKLAYNYKCFCSYQYEPKDVLELCNFFKNKNVFKDYDTLIKQLNHLFGEICFKCGRNKIETELIGIDIEGFCPIKFEHFICEQCIQNEETNYIKCIICEIQHKFLLKDF